MREGVEFTLGKTDLTYVLSEVRVELIQKPHSLQIQCKMRRLGVGMNYASLVFLENELLDGGPMELFQEFCDKELAIFQAKEKILFLSLLYQFKNETDPVERRITGIERASSNNSNISNLLTS